MWSWVFPPSFNSGVKLQSTPWTHASQHLSGACCDRQQHLICITSCWENALQSGHHKSALSAVECIVWCSQCAFVSLLHTWFSDDTLAQPRMGCVAQERASTGVILKGCVLLVVTTPTIIDLRFSVIIQFLCDSVAACETNHQCISRTIGPTEHHRDGAVELFECLFVSADL